MTIPDFTRILHDAAGYIEDHGWAQEEHETEDGRVSLHGAIRRCSPSLAAAHVAQAVLSKFGLHESWDDEEGGVHAQSDVTLVLSAAAITDEHLEYVFGPQYRETIEIILRASELTDAESRSLSVEYEKIRETPELGIFPRAEQEALIASVDHGYQNATRLLGRVIMSEPAYTFFAVEYAIVALSTRHLIAETGFTREHYQTLAGPWQTTIGPLHPDDKAAS